MPARTAVSDDRLLRLGMARAALRWAGIGSVEEYRRASRAQLAHFGDHASLLRRLIREGRPDVLAALFDPPDWHVALLLTHPQDRLLVIEGRDSLIYRVDAPDAERAVWETIKASRQPARP